MWHQISGVITRIVTGKIRREENYIGAQDARGSAEGLMSYAGHQAACRCSRALQTYMHIQNPYNIEAMMQIISSIYISKQYLSAHKYIILYFCHLLILKQSFEILDYHLIPAN